MWPTDSIALCSVSRGKNRPWPSRVTYIHIAHVWHPECQMHPRTLVTFLHVCGNNSWQMFPQLEHVAVIQCCNCARNNKLIRIFFARAVLFASHNVIFTARSELRKVLFLALSVIFVCLVCLWIKYLENRWTDLRQIHREDVFHPSLGWVWMSKSKVKGHGHQQQISSPLKMSCNALAANNVTQQQTGPFRRCRGWLECTAWLRAVYVW